MSLLSPVSTGFVPSLEAMPLVAQAQSSGPWRLHPRPSYGRIIRHLLTGELAAGLIPWELAITELITKPAQKGVWAIPLVVHACPMELVLTSKAMKVVYPPRTKKGGAENRRLVFGIEARCSLTRYQILTWQLQVAGRDMDPPGFKVLPMELMRKGLEAGTIDGMVAPTPWGMQAAAEGSGRMDPAFEPGKYAQQVVLVCQRRLADLHAPLLSEMPERLAIAHKRLADEQEFTRQALAMAEMGPPKCDPGQLLAAARQHLKDIVQEDFQPSRRWLETELRLLAERIPLGEGMEFSEMAEHLECCTSAVAVGTT